MPCPDRQSLLRGEPPVVCQKENLPGNFSPQRAGSLCLYFSQHSRLGRVQSHNLSIEPSELLNRVCPICSHIYNKSDLLPPID